LPTTLQTLLAEPGLREAHSPVSHYDDPKTPTKVLAAYSQLSATK